jgi:hypothetical protein
MDVMRQGKGGMLKEGRKMGSDQEPIRGPQSSTFDPSTDGLKKKFKGGVKNGKNDALCKTRYQQVAVTALGSLPTNSS